MFEDCTAICEAQTASMALPPQGQAASTAESSTAAPMRILLQERFPPIRSRTDVDQLTNDFNTKHVCDVFTDAITPARDYLRRLKHQAKAGGYEWMRWTSIVSVAQEKAMLKGKRHKAKAAALA